LKHRQETAADPDDSSSNQRRPNKLSEGGWAVSNLPFG
jgi:hypothetical protein